MGHGLRPEASGQDMDPDEEPMLQWVGPTFLNPALSTQCPAPDSTLEYSWPKIIGDKTILINFLIDINNHDRWMWLIDHIFNDPNFLIDANNHTVECD